MSAYSQLSPCQADFRSGADVKSGSVFCRECDDIIVDDTFEEIYRSTSLHIEEKATKFVCESAALCRVRSFSDTCKAQRKHREAYKAWVPNGKDDMADDAIRVGCSGMLLWGSVNTPLISVYDRSTGLAKPWPNMLPQCHSSILPRQSLTEKLLLERHA